ncbi:MAG: response regulator [Kiritimatiellae bacterium]|nr:response regulator [Kiritimatiellia bacterium]
MKKIYIVDDDRDIVEFISTILQSEGYETSCQYDDNDIVANVKAFEPDLIVLDVMFPEDESAGFRMARELHMEPATTAMPILMLSAINKRGIYPGKFKDHDKDDAFLPVAAFVEKPITPGDLIAKIKALIAA